MVLFATDEELRPRGRRSRSDNERGYTGWALPRSLLNGNHDVGLVNRLDAGVFSWWSAMPVVKASVELCGDGAMLMLGASPAVMGGG